MLKHLFIMLTGLDGESLDVGRVLLTIAILIGLGLECFVVIIRNAPFDLLQFGTGVGALLMCGGGMLFIKRATEPTAPTGEDK